MHLADTFGTEAPLVGMVHLPPLPGTPGFDGDRGTVRERALDDGRALAAGGADGLVVSGPATGAATDASDLRAVVDARDEVDPSVPVFVGSGVTAANAADLLAVADGAIVGTALKVGDETTAPVDADRVADLVSAVEG
jgi:predicted TIM-barrel enzyme